MTAGALPHRFNLPAQALRGLIDRTRFAISTEETRYYLNGIYLHAAESEGTRVLRAVATDGHRLARVEEPLPEGAGSMPGVIIPRKTVNELRKLLDEVTGNVEVALSDTRIQFHADAVLLTSKLIDGTFPEYERVIPRGNDKVLRVGKKDFADAVGRVAAISAERSRPVKLSLARDLLVLSAASPEQGTATEELDSDHVKYEAGPLEIGFQARYLNDITDQIDGRGGVPLLRRFGADGGARRGGCQRALRADADAGISPLPFPCLRGEGAGRGLRLLHRHRLRQVARLIHVGALQHRHMIGQQLHRDRIQDRRHERIDRRQHDRLGGDAAQLRRARRIAEHDHLAAARRGLLQVGRGLLEQRPRRRDGDHRHVRVDQRDRAVLHLAGGIALGVDVADLLQLQRAFQRDREAVAAAEVQHVARLRDARAPAP